MKTEKAMAANVAARTPEARSGRGRGVASARVTQPARIAKATKQSKKTVKATRSEKDDKGCRLGFGRVWHEICKKQRSLMISMIIMLVASIALLIFSLVMLRPQGTLVIVGYGDVYGEIVGLSEGYRYGSWTNMLAFPILALVFGILHNFLVLRVYQKYGKNLASMVVYTTLLLVAGTFVVLFRLLREW